MLLLYANTITPRLRYIVDFIGNELLPDPITITTDKQQFTSFTGPRINYSETDFSEEEFYIRPVSLLFEETIVPQQIECFELNYAKAFFATRGDCPFDVLAASFYLLSRYEEYLPHEKDAYGRYAHTNSLAYREGFLNLPLINLWLADLRKSLQLKFPSLLFKRGHFKFIPSYDIDMAWSYRQKGWMRNTAGFMRSLKNGRWSQVGERWSVLRGKEKDPFDCYEWLDALHLYCKVKPIYFFLVAGEQKGYDRNIPTSSKAFRDLVEYYAGVYEIGLHPSWQSSVAPAMDTLMEEKQWMEVIIDRPVAQPRQHYIKFHIPEVYRRLITAGLLKDYSMGYGSINGFRASVASCFYWFDLEKN
ncbi:MAG: hypothetical protein JST39_10290, partial [Bacteroidetes bacterium]|nr:hypothetical protein [Bacteroidota bacterium]